MTPFVANGVTQILDMSAFGSSFGQRIAIERGEVIGPHLALAAVIHGGRPDGRVADTVSDGRQAVRDAKAEGYDFIKTYSGLKVEVFHAVIDEANKRGMKVLGHIPDAFEGRLAEAFVPGFSMIAHAEELAKHSENFSDDDAQRFARLAKSNDTWLSPTLTVWQWITAQTRSLDVIGSSPNLKYVHPLIRGRWLEDNGYNNPASPPSARRIAIFERMKVFNNKLVAAFKAEGVPLVAGTDTLTSGVVAGFSLHDELELLAAAGLSAEEVLASATRLPAVWLGVDTDRGTIEPGKRADLLLLDENPLASVANTRKIAGVVTNGRWSSRSTLDTTMADLARRNTASAAQFDWRRVLIGVGSKAAKRSQQYLEVSMFDATTIVAWTALVFVLAITPGPDTVLVASHAARGGLRQGLLALLGIQLGGIWFACLFSFGLLSLLTAVPALFLTIKVAGAAYLAWLGFSMIVHAVRTPSSDIKTARPRLLDNALLQGLLTNVLNPKVALFYVAALPQFVPQSENGPLLGGVLILIHYSIGGTWLTCVALSVVKARAISWNKALLRWVEGAIGIVFVAVAGRLALASR